MKECCGVCLYSKRDMDLDLRCLRFPPQIIGPIPIADGLRAGSQFPKVHEEAWCGEWKPKEGEE